MYIHTYWSAEFDNQVITSASLPTPLQLFEDYEIAVLESYMSPYFVNGPENRYMKIIVEKEHQTTKVFGFAIPFQNYTGGNDIVLAILEGIKENSGTLTKNEFDISATKENNLKITLGEGSKIILDDELRYFIVAEYLDLKPKKKVTYRLKPELYDNFFQFYLTSNIISPNHCLRNSLLPILAPALQFDFQTDEPIYRSYEKPIYQKINHRWLEKIEIQFRDELR